MESKVKNMKLSDDASGRGVGNDFKVPFPVRMYYYNVEINKFSKSGRTSEFRILDIEPVASGKEPHESSSRSKRREKIQKGEGE